MQDYRKLHVWLKAHELACGVYRVTRQFPADERFGVTSQIRRAAVSIAANIAEGAGRASQTDFARFLNISEGSAAEVEYLLLLSADVILEDRPDLAPELEKLRDHVDHVKRMLFSLRRQVLE